MFYDIMSILWLILACYCLLFEHDTDHFVIALAMAMANVALSEIGKINKILDVTGLKIAAETLFAVEKKRKEKS
jgi:hypothetical protein